jgi:hypothetical protein
MWRTRCRWIVLSLVAVVLAMIQCGAATGQDITSNLIGWRKLTESSGTTAADSSSSNVAGTYTNGVSLASSTAAPNGYVGPTFDGVDDLVAIGSQATYDVTGSITVAARFKVAASIPLAKSLDFSGTDCFTP